MLRSLPWVLLALTLLWGGCKAASGPAAPPTEPAGAKPPAAQDATIPTERTLRFVAISPEFLDPNLIAESSGARIAGQLFEGLVTVAPHQKGVVPALAKSWEHSPDGRDWTFHLRPEARWSDGTPITSADFLYSAQRALDPKTGSRNAEQYWIIEGAKAFNHGDTTDFATVGMRATDPHTLQLRLVSAAPYLLDLLSTVQFAPVPKAAIAAHGAHWTDPANIVTSGPFTLSLWKHGERLELGKNPKYWDSDAVWLNKIVIYETNSEATSFDWYTSGKIDWSPGLIPPEKLKPLLRSGRPDFHVVPVLCTYYYVFNLTAPPFDDARVRHAFNMAFDKKQLATQVLGSGQEPARALIPHGLAAITGYKSPLGDPFNPQEARRLLAQAGYPQGHGLPPITLIYNTSEGHRRIAEFYQRSIKEHLGIDLHLQNMEWKSLLQRLKARDYQLSRASWCADYPDPETFLQVFHGQGQSNYPGYKSPAYDRLVEQLRATSDPQTRTALARQAETLLNTDLPLMPFYFFTRSYLLRPYVSGLAPDPIDRVNLKYVWFGPKGAPRPAGH